MRKFLTTTASATFFGNSPYTARIMKDHLEYIVRNQPGMYAVVLVLPTEKDKVHVICNWGDYFGKQLQQNANPSAVLDRIASKCPKVVHMMTGDDPIAQVSLLLDSDGWLHGIGMEVKLPAPYRMPSTSWAAGKSRPPSARCTTTASASTRRSRSIVPSPAG